MKISKLTFFYSIMLIISASFLRQVLQFFHEKLGRTYIADLLWVVFGIFGLFLLIRVWTIFSKKQLHTKFLRAAIILTIFLLGIYYASTFNIPEERIHLVKYGILGFLISKDNFSGKGLWIIFIGTLFCFSVACIDETFQYFLPMRVGDIRDVGFGSIGGFWGTSFFLALFYKKE